MLCMMLAWPFSGVCAPTVAVPQIGSAKQIVEKLVANEDQAALHKDHYAYLCKERSERTGGHLWMEKVVETDAGKVRMLLEEDGKPLNPERIAQERGRLAAIVADPTAFKKHSQSIKDDEAHLRQMLAFAPRAYLFSEPREDEGFLRIDFKPNPDYVPQSIEQRVLHNMTGTMLIDPIALRLHYIAARLPAHVSIGYGLLAVIHAGSNFSAMRDRLGQPDWKTTQVDANIDGRIIFFKSVDRKQHVEHSNFVRVANDLSVAQAVSLAEQ